MNRHTVAEHVVQVEKAAGGESVPKFLRTHPVSSDRIKRIKEASPEQEGQAAHGFMERSCDLLNWQRHCAEYAKIATARPCHGPAVSYGP